MIKVRMRNSIDSEKKEIYVMDRVPCNNDLTGTGKSLSEALIFASTNQQYDDRLFIELPLQYMKIASSEHAQNLHVVYTNFCFDIQNNLCTQHVLSIACNFHVLNL